MSWHSFIRFCLAIFFLLFILSRFGQQTFTLAQSQSTGEDLPPGFVREIVVKGLDGPTAFAIAPDRRIYVTQKSGTVRVFQSEKLLSENFIDISHEVNHAYNRGLVGIALHPDFPRTPFVYLSFVYQPPEANSHKETGARLSRVIRVTADRNNLNKALPNSEVIILGANGTFDKIGNPDRSDSSPLTCQDTEGTATKDCIPVEGTAHQANMIRFGRDNALYVGVGDGGEHASAGFRAQDINSLSGKILRINPINGNGYSNNPFYDGNLSSNRSKVFMLGLRNPFRITFHPVTNELFIGDVGKSKWEEVNRGRSGANFGWPCFEGLDITMTSPPCDKFQKVPNSLIFPVYSFSHTEQRVAIIGGDFYTGSLFPSEYHNNYFFGDYNVGTIWAMRDSGNNIEVDDFAKNFSGVVQVSTGPDDCLYILSIRAGILYRICWTPSNS